MDQIKVFKHTDVTVDLQGCRKYVFLKFKIMNQLPDNSLCIYDVTSVT